MNTFACNFAVPCEASSSKKNVGNGLLNIPFYMLTFQVCRVLKAYYLSSKESTRTSGVVSPESRIEEALGSCVLPSLQLIPANPAVDMEIWGVLSLLPYEVCHVASCFVLLPYSVLSNLVPFMFRSVIVCMVNGRRTLNKTQLSLLQGKLQRLPTYSVTEVFFSFIFYLKL